MILNKQLILALTLCFSMPLAGCGKNDKMPKPTNETCSDDYLKKHKDIEERITRYNNGFGLDLKNAPKDVLDYVIGCRELKTKVAGPTEPSQWGF